MAIPRTRVFRQAALVSAAFLLAACGSSAGNLESTTPVRGGALTVALGPGITCLDPQQTISLDARSATRAVADSLTDQNPVNGAVVPWLATSWEISPDATAYTFRLAPNVTFSDGTPFTATVVRDNLDYIKKTLGGKALRGASYLKNYTGTDIVDDHTAVVRFSAPTIQFLTASSTPAFAMLAPASTRATPEDRCQGKLIGTGPFVLSGYQQNQTIELTRRTGYTAHSALAKHDGDAYLDRISFKIIPVSNVRSGSLTSDQVDVATQIAAQDTTAITARKDVVTSRIQPGLPSSFFVNIGKPGLNDPAVRQAMQIGLDRPSLVKAVLGSQFNPATSTLTKGMPAYSDQSGQLTFDQAKANGILDAAGWVKGADGTRARNGTRLAMTVVYSSDIGPYYTSLLQLVQQQWQAIGISVTLNNITQASLSAALVNHDYDLWISSLTEAEPNVLRTFVGGYYPDQQALAASGISKLLTDQQAATDPAARAAEFGQVQQKLVGNGYLIPLFESAQLVAHGPRVGGLRFEFGANLSFYDTWVQR